MILIFLKLGVIFILDVTHIWIEWEKDTLVYISLIIDSMINNRIRSWIWFISNLILTLIFFSSLFFIFLLHFLKVVNELTDLFFLSLSLFNFHFLLSLHHIKIILYLMSFYNRIDMWINYDFTFFNMIYITCYSVSVIFHRFIFHLKRALCLLTVF